MLLPNLPPPCLEVAGGHMMEVKSTEAALCLGGTPVIPDGHGLLVCGVTTCPPRVSMVWGNVSPSLTEMKFFGEQTSLTFPSS